VGVANLPEHGEQVTIVEPFRGLKGVVENFSGHCWVSLQIESVNKIVTIDLPARFIEKTKEQAEVTVVSG
jgi:hypothetical protein